MLQPRKKQYKEMAEMTMKKLVNLTPHEVNIVLDNGETVTVPASGQLARVSAKTVRADFSINEIPVTQTLYGEVEGLPDPEEGTAFIVSQLVASRVPTRYDVYIPNEAIRDEAGRIIGCRSLGRV